jgi:hypothetical protein
LGQFYTTNYEYILQEMKIPNDVKNIIEPFCGNGDLLNFISDKDKYKLECYDIDPKQKYITKKDTIKNPPEYKNKFIITNPPYLSRNKSDCKELYDKYKVNDLYKCFIKEIITNKCMGGIIIIPLNFFSSIRKMDIELRKEFLSNYKIERVNIFLEKVFNDTTYTVCSIFFKSGKSDNIIFHIYPQNTILNMELTKQNNWTIGGEIYNLPQTKKYTIGRLTDIKDKNTNILIKCIDDSKNSKICLKIVDDEDIHVDDTTNKSERSYGTLTINPVLSLEKQKKLVQEFNVFLNDLRDKYQSLFLSNYREGDRKRISFDLVYNIINYLLQKN